MTRVSDAGHWLGLCRKHPALPVLQGSPGLAVSSAHEDLPGGGGPGALRRGAGAALAGITTLCRNRNLLWFTFLAGLVLAGSAILEGTLGYLTWTMQPFIGETEWIVLNFIVEFTVLFLLVYLFAGLVLGVSSAQGGQASFLKGLSRAKKFLSPLILWSGILSLAGMLLFSGYFYAPGWLWENSLFLAVTRPLYEPVNLLMQFPFNPTLTPYSFFNPSRPGGIPPALWIYPSGIAQAMTFSVINLLLVALTPFVVPRIVLEKKTVAEAVAGSYALIKKIGAETAACILSLVAVVLGVVMTYLLVQAASGQAAPGWGSAVPPANAWTALALAYDGALFCFALVMATAGGIAVLTIYTSAKERLEPGPARDLPEVP